MDVKKLGSSVPCRVHRACRRPPATAQEECHGTDDEGDHPHPRLTPENLGCKVRVCRLTSCWEESGIGSHGSHGAACRGIREERRGNQLQRREDGGQQRLSTMQQSRLQLVCGAMLRRISSRARSRRPELLGHAWRAEPANRHATLRLLGYSDITRRRKAARRGSGDDGGRGTDRDEVAGVLAVGAEVVVVAPHAAARHVQRQPTAVVDHLARGARLLVPTMQHGRRPVVRLHRRRVGNAAASPAAVVHRAGRVVARGCVVAGSGRVIARRGGVRRGVVVVGLLAAARRIVARGLVRRLLLLHRHHGVVRGIRLLRGRAGRRSVAGARQRCGIGSE